MSDHEDRLVERVAEAIWDSEQRRVQDDYSINGVFELVVTRWDEAGERNRQWMRGIARGAIAAVRAEGDGLEALLERALADMAERYPDAEPMITLMHGAGWNPNRPWYWVGVLDGKRLRGETMLRIDPDTYDRLSAGGPMLRSTITEALAALREGE